jgi:hypothetical protein
MDGVRDQFFYSICQMLPPAFSQAYHGTRCDNPMHVLATGITAKWTSAVAFELASDLESGSWDRRYGRFRMQPFFEGSLKIIVGRT